MFDSSRKEEVSLRPSRIVGTAECLMIGRAILFHTKSVCRPLSSLGGGWVASQSCSSLFSLFPAAVQMLLPQQATTQKKEADATSELRPPLTDIDWKHETTSSPTMLSFSFILIHMQTHAHFLLSELLWNYTGNFKRTSTIYIQKDIWNGSFSTCPLSDPL